MRASFRSWIGGVGLDPRLFGTHPLWRTKATLIYRRTGNLRAVQLLPTATGSVPGIVVRGEPGSLTWFGCFPTRHSRRGDWWCRVAGFVSGPRGRPTI